MAIIKTHQPCVKCTSSDGASYYDDGGSYCFAGCGYVPPEGDAPLRVQPPPSDDANEEPKQSLPDAINIIQTGQYRGIPDRAISSASAKQYSTIWTEARTLFGYFAPDDTLAPVAVKIRYPDKRFPITGDWQKAGLFGQHLYTTGAKYITITEGEYDAIAAYQMLGSKWAVVSVKNGANSALKDCKAQFEYLDSFEHIVICFDADEPGVKAAAEVAELFGGKAKVFKHSKGYKDACDYLREGQDKLFTDLWWKAERFVPEGIVNGTDLWEKVNTPVEASDFLFPFPSINDITYGIRKGEIVTIGAGSGVGKTHFVKELIYYGLQHTDSNIGLLCLEESNQSTALGLMSLAANKPLHLPDVPSTEEERLRAFNATVGTGRVFLFNHFGSTSIESILARIRFMVKGLGCDTILLDHISIVVSAQGEKDERKAIDELMTKLRMMVEETNIRMIVVSHLNRPSTGKPHEEGGHTALVQFRGSGSIAHLSDTVIGLERNGQADDNLEKNTTRPRILKNRFCGITGQTKGIYYDIKTARMTELEIEGI